MKPSVRLRRFPRDISFLLQSELSLPKQTVSFLQEQRKDPWLEKLFRYLDDGNLPVDDIEARKVLLQSSLFTVYNGMLQYTDGKKT